MKDGSVMLLSWLFGILLGSIFFIPLGIYIGTPQEAVLLHSCRLACAARDAEYSHHQNNFCTCSDGHTFRGEYARMWVEP